MSGEQKAFVFAVSFIIIFSSLTATIPVDLLGEGGPSEVVTPINPNLLIDFEETEAFDTTDFVGTFILYFEYELPNTVTTWSCIENSGSFSVAEHVLFYGFWLGHYGYSDFISDNGTNYGIDITFAEIDSDAEDGTARYELISIESGNSAGGFIFYWNDTTYTNSTDAWDNNALFLLHGIGFTTDTNIVSLLVSLLLLQLPDTPILVSVLLVTPLWASIVFVLWYIIKESIPFI